MKLTFDILLLYLQTKFLTENKRKFHKKCINIFKLFVIYIWYTNTFLKMAESQRSLFFWLSDSFFMINRRTRLSRKYNNKQNIHSELDGTFHFLSLIVLSHASSYSSLSRLFRLQIDYELQNILIKIYGI